MAWQEGPALLRIAFETVEEVSAAPDRAFASHSITAGLSRLISCDLAAENTVSLSTGQMSPTFHPHQLWERPESRLAQHVGRHPLIAHFACTGDNQARRMSDVCAPDVWLRGPVYRNVFAEHGLRYVLAYGARLPDGALEGVALSRTSADFTDAERRLLSVLAPRLLVLRRRLSEPGSLTTRERQVARLFEAGLPSSRIATQLGVTTRTVDKHLEHIYRKLGVHSAGAAIAVLNAQTCTSAHQAARQLVE